MLERTRARTRERLAEARVRETKFLMSFDLVRVNKRLLILLSVFIALNFFDTFTTLLAIQAGPTFVEHNPIAARLFQLNFSGFVVALVLKYMPILPLAYATFVGAKESRGLGLRIVKVSTFMALAAADVFYVLVVSSNSLNLISFYV
jgi:uncharacterized protein DUF5658